MENRRIESDTIRADYNRLAARLDAAIVELQRHFKDHAIEALAMASVDPRRCRLYCCDVGHAITTIDQLRGSSAVERGGSRC